jgi:hypothetical protein
MSEVTVELGSGEKIPVVDLSNPTSLVVRLLSGLIVLGLQFDLSFAAPIEDILTSLTIS